MNSIGRLATAACAVVVVACAGNPTTQSTAQPTLQGLSILSPGTAFSVGSTLQLDAFGLYSDGAKAKLTDQVTWSSSDDALVAVDQTGVARLLKAGRARVTVQLDGKAAGVSFEVRAATVRALELYPDDLFEAPRGLMPQLQLFATFSDGTRRDVTVEATWTSAGVGAWPMAEPGHYRLDAQGDVTLIARFGGAEARRELRVLPPAVVAVRLEPLADVVRPGQRLTPQVIATFTDGAFRDVTLDARVFSLDEHIVAPSAGVLVAVAPGRARIVAEYGGFTSTRAALVTAKALTALSSTLPHADVPAGRELVFRVLATFDDGSMEDVTDVADWGSSSIELVTVNAGVVKALSQGLVDVTATYGERSLTFTVQVLPPVLEGLAITLPPSRLHTGQLATFAVLGRFSDGSLLNVNSVATLRSSPFVQVDLGGEFAVVEGLAVGPATIEAEVSGVITGTVVEVSDLEIKELTIVRPASDHGGLARQVRARALYADGVVVDVTELCAWSSSDPALVDVNAYPGWRGEVVGSGEAEFTAKMLTLEATFPWVP